MSLPIPIPESAVRRQVLDYLHALGYQVWQIECMQYPRPATQGVPDLFVFRKGWTGWIELKTYYKRSKRNLTQIARGDELEVEGIPYVVARSPDDVRDWLKEHGQKTEEG